MNDESDIAAMLHELASDIRDTLGKDLVGLYVTGSYVAGGFDPDVSDLDLVAVTRVDAADLDLLGIRAMHQGFVGRYPEWSDRIEVVYIGVAALASFRTSRGSIAVISPGEPFHLRPETPAEWVQNWYQVRTAGVVLAGPPPAALVPPVEWSEFAEACMRYVLDLAGRDLQATSPGALAYTLLTVCRAEEAVIGGRAVSKQEAAEIARRRRPGYAEVIAGAVECRQTKGHRGGFDQAGTRAGAIEFIRTVAAGLPQAAD